MGEAFNPAKLSGSVQKSDLYGTLATRAAEQLERAAQRFEDDHDRSSADRLRILAREARVLAETFRDWKRESARPRT
jgi:hypothetical protein